MQGLTLEEPGRLVTTTLPAPEPPGPGEALVQVHRIGVCGTDYHAFRGRQPFFTYPRILGHELGVEVVALGDGVTGVQVGDLCAVEPYLVCGECIACRKGKTNCCVHMQVLGVHTEGGMREFFSVPASKLLASKSLTVDQLALVETLGIGAHAVARADIERGEWALVIGAGPIGLGVMQFAKQAGARVIALDVKQNRLEFCQSELKVDKIVQAGDDVLERVRELTGGDLPTVVFDATGYPPSMEAAFDYIAPGGRLVFVGLVSSDLKFHDPHFHRREITLLASRNATNSDLKRVVALMETGEIDTTPWITHRAALGDVCETFPQWLQEEWIIKAVIEV